MEEVNQSKRKPGRKPARERKEERNDQELERADAEANGHGSEG